MTRLGKPEIFNTDQGAEFTSEAFTGVLRAAEVRISMDGKGRCLDNVFVERLGVAAACSPGMRPGRMHRVQEVPAAIELLRPPAEPARLPEAQALSLQAPAQVQAMPVALTTNVRVAVWTEG